MAEASGRHWCERFPGSQSPEDLTPDWRGRVYAFLSALQRAGASVNITATYRPPERAYLMHWCWMIANLSQAPGAVPPMAGVDIDWTHHGDSRAARAAADAMVEAFDLEYAPSLNSRHTLRRAIDMTICWHDRLSIRDFDGNLHYILGEPQDGTNAELIKIGASFGVIKLISDRPHWSDDGH
jgi:hypothetical protein